MFFADPCFTRWWTLSRQLSFSCQGRKKKKDDKRSQENRKLLSRPKKTSWYLARKLDTELVLERSFCTLMWADEELFCQSGCLGLLSAHLVCAMEPVDKQHFVLVKLFSLVSETTFGANQTLLTITVITPIFISSLTRKEMESKGHVSHKST